MSAGSLQRERRRERRPYPPRSSSGSARSRSFERRATQGRARRLHPASARAASSLPARRVGVFRIVIVVVFLALALRLVAVQAFSSGHYASIGASQLTTTVQVTAQRGGIFDRDGAVLALSVPASDVIGDPYLVSDPAGEARKLGPVLGVPDQLVQGELSERSGFVYLAHQVSEQVAAKVSGLGLTGINVLPTSRRVDPPGALGAPVIGSVNATGDGDAGLEYQYDSLLAGHDGTMKEEENPSGVILPGSSQQLVASRAGTGIELTLDQPLQYVTEQDLGAAIESSHAKSGAAIVMNTHTGEILAMASLVAEPSQKKVAEAPENLALDQVYEPGSVFKVVTFSAALADGIISPSTVLTVPNSLLIDGWTFHDAESHPTERLSATQILAQSSNIGTIEIAEALGEDRLAAQISALGFGQGTGLDFPGESEGIVRPDPSQWSGSDIGSTPIGQDDAVTAQQVLDMINTVATGGVFVPPSLVRATVSPDGSLSEPKTAPTRRLFSPEVSSELTTMMEQVVQDGTAVSAGVPGYSVAGKTGTAQIPDSKTGGYVPGAYMATFAGFAPAQDPALSAIVVLDQPTPIFGGVVSAPVFSEVMQYALHRYGVPPAPATAPARNARSSSTFPSAQQ